jgi:protein phosphatase
MVELRWATATDRGRVRSENEDSFLAAPPVFLVADGMGGRAGGAEASRLAVAAFERFRAGDPPSAEEVLAAVADANSAILEAATQPGFEGMGTTLVGLVQVAEGDAACWLAFNIGDSRLYRLGPARGGGDGNRLEQVTVDHSEVQELIGAGLIGADQRRGHPRGHLITRALGIRRRPQVDTWVLTREAGERFLLCSDGLSDEVPDDEIARLLAAGPEPVEAANLLVQAAVEAGGRDNVTVVVVEVPGRPDRD